MTTYGYLLYQFGIHEGLKRKQEALHDLKGEHALDVVTRDLKALLADGALSNMPRQNIEDADDVEAATEGEPDEDKNKRVTRVESVDEKGWTVRFKVTYGRTGTHELAVSAAGEDDIDLKNHAPSRTYRGVFIIPPNGRVGIVAIEVISRSKPLAEVVRWLRSKSPVPWRIKVESLVDQESFLDALVNSRNVYMELEKRQPSEDATPAKSKKMRLYAPLTTATLREKVKVRVEHWVAKRNSPPNEDGKVELADPQEEARQLAAILGPEVAGIDFEDGRVVAEDADDISRSFRPSARLDLFTYYLGRDTEPSDSKFYDHALASAKRMFAALDIDMPDQWEKVR